MRKSAPAMILTTLIAFASTSALALGDRAKEKKAADAAATPSSQPAKPANGMTSGVEPKTQVAQNDARCDESKYPSRSAMPKDCFDKTSTGAAATSGTQGQSGGASSPSGAGASSSPSSSPSSSSSSPSK